MDPSPDVLADEVRMKRHAVDNDFGLRNAAWHTTCC